MNVKFIFDPIDKLIDQAKDYILDQDLKNKTYKILDQKAEVIRPELEKRKSELLSLLEKIEPDATLKQQLEESLKNIDYYLKTIMFLAEKELSEEVLSEEDKQEKENSKEMRERYVNLQILRIEEQLNNTNNFFEVADYANEIWADFDLFEEFHREEVVVQMLVNRMNETNTKNTETRMGKDLSKTLEHIRFNLLKTSAWNEDEIREYQKERNKKLREVKEVNISKEKEFNVLFLGGSPNLLEYLRKYYDIPPKLRPEWKNLENPFLMEELQKSHNKKDLVILLSFFPQNEIIVELVKFFSEKEIRLVLLSSFNKGKIIKTLEDELIKISFNDQFG